MKIEAYSLVKSRIYIKCYLLIETKLAVLIETETFWLLTSGVSQSSNKISLLKRASFTSHCRIDREYVFLLSLVRRFSFMEVSRNGLLCRTSSTMVLSREAYFI